MTDSLKLAEMQRTSIEFERQRHLANWFIKSGPHMAKPSPSLSINGGTKNGTITAATGNPLFFVVSTGQIKHQPIPPSGIGVQTNPNGAAITSAGTVTVSGSKTALSRSQVITSQENFPLQIVTTTSSQEGGRKSKLRRFNSHDTSANMFSVADFENARLARRNEIEMKQRQQRLKMNSLSSGGDCSTGDSKGSKYSNESQTDPLSAEVFLDRYSLPRVVRISYKQKFSHETLQSSSSNGSSSTQSSASLSKNDGSSKQNGELYLLYRHLRQRYVYHGFNTKTGIANRKKGVMIPQEFPGYFSLINDKGLPTATQYTSLIQLVRERVHKFISVDSLPAFTESQSTTNAPDGFVATRPHYIKSTARGGQVFRLLAVFEDGNQQDSSNTKFSSSLTSSSSNNNTGREKEKGRYAQLFNENRQILYVSLTAKGKFYEIEPSIPQILQKVSGFSCNSTTISQTNLEHNSKQRKINPDCVHRISNLINPDKEFPINLKFISASSGANSSSSSSSVSIPENLTITHITKENVLIACPIDDATIDSGQNLSNLQLKKLPITNEMTFMKCLLGFENEQRMLSNPNVQNILKFCQFNCDQFIKTIEVEVFNRPERSTSKSRVDGLKKLKPLNFPRLLRREKTTIAHEKEDSIIFLSKNDLANLEAKQEQQQQQHQQTQNQQQSNSNEQQAQHQNRMFSDKMKVFQSTKKKWFKRNDKNTSMTCLDIDIQAKRMSMQRYNDMSKLLQERFGEEVLAASGSSSNNRPASEIGGSIRISNTNSADRNIPFSNNILNNQKKIQKSLSLQDVDLIDKQPDLLPSNYTTETTTLAESMTSISSGNGLILNQSINPLDEDLKTDVDTINNINANTSRNDGNQCTNNFNKQKQFISEKMYSEFHVKTKQYSKSSSSLHQLLHFAVPQKMNVVETKKVKPISSINSNKNEIENSIRDLDLMPNSKQLDFLIGDPVSNNLNDDYSSTTIIDDLPYSSVRDSLLVSEGCTTSNHNMNADSFSSVMINNGLMNNNDFSYPNCSSCIINNCTSSNIHHQIGTTNNATNGCSSTNRITNNNLIEIFDDPRENIYAEICHNNIDSSNGGSCSDITTAGVAISRIQINGNENVDDGIEVLSNIDNDNNHHPQHKNDEKLNYPEIVIKGASVVQATSYINKNNIGNSSKDNNKQQQQQQHKLQHLNSNSPSISDKINSSVNGVCSVSGNCDANDVDVDGANIDNIYNTLK
ncbi:putative uncharacterized protein DDB_G0277255 [Condylostylus longicornis]|uniref:putative uncharacterized protein DDB_G0277255 n=1 Tax=Condylostylus longicornis TaxID=2530218 RepID=UPI00244E1295|nr:putative uncharacterized protein DDB_G0277255 [Condylostylus longicornis]XP_055372153.1 putative uncharacterized protein DDB_G0277255 [Condylostylus longicornis]XP_055372154.1 putative uncharacterized protein DDB_G0277255 [Condylostylus longicornis]XP_055372155.1 putative uncharacterized protein DDB_G0277255 [Condylostylus longicornis]